MIADVFWYSLITAVACGLGAIPFFFVHTISKRFLALGSAIAAGCMLGASFLLIGQGHQINSVGTLLGTFAGLVFITLVQKILEKRDDLHITNFSATDTRKMLLIVGIMTLHSFAEGIGIGVSFAEGATFGLLITIAMAIHNIPEGLAISLVLVPRGVSAWKAVWWSIFSSIPQVIMAVPAFIFVNHFRDYLAPGLGFAAGAMIWMAINDLLPEAQRGMKRSQIFWATGLSIVGMLALESLLA